MLRRSPWLLAALLALPLAASCGGGGEAEDKGAAPGVLIGGPEESAAPAASLAPFDAPPLDNRSETTSPEASREPVLVSLDWLGGPVTLPALPTTFAPDRPDAGLQAAIAAALQGREGKFSVVVHNLEDGSTAAVGEDDVYYAASLFKAAVLLEAYRQRDAGELDFSEVLTLDEEMAENDLGTLEYLDMLPGDMITLGDALKGMVIVSDTSLASLAVETIGGERVDETLREIGATTMEVHNRELPTTADDMVVLMEAIAAGEGVSEASRHEMLAYLAQEWFREGVIAGVPEGTAVAHKTGSFSEAVHDVALVWGLGGPYVIAVLTDGSGGWEAVADVSRAVWQYFEEHP